MAKNLHVIISAAAASGRLDRYPYEARKHNCMNTTTALCVCLRGCLDWITVFDFLFHPLFSLRFAAADGSLLASVGLVEF